MSAGELTEKLGLQNLRNRRVSDPNISPCLYQERIVVEIASYVESYKDSRVKMSVTILNHETFVLQQTGRHWQ